jgi:cytochrome subunit of sulfide dehydrogenase
MNTMAFARAVLLAAAGFSAGLAQSQPQPQSQSQPQPQPQPQSDEQQLLRTRSLAATCAQCHGTAGRALPEAVLPGLAGLPAGYIAEQMKAFKSGARSATVMHQLAKGYSDAQIEQLAAYFSAQKAQGPQ